MSYNYKFVCLKADWLTSVKSLLQWNNNYLNTKLLLLLIDIWWSKF